LHVLSDYEVENVPWETKFIGGSIVLLLVVICWFIYYIIKNDGI